jgi:Sec-independent protein translocase protein TatA
MVVVAVVLLLLGPDKLPEVAHKLGSSWRALKRLQEKVENEVRSAIPDLPSTGDIARIARSPVSLLNQLAERVDANEASAAALNDPPVEEVPPYSSEALLSPRQAPSIRRTDNSSMPPDPSLN